MTLANATEYALTLSLTDADRLALVAALVSGALGVCPDCAFTHSGPVCEVCAEACFEDQAGRYDAAAADRDAFTYRADDYRWQNFCDTRAEACA